MTGELVEKSPQPYARTAGLLGLIIVVAGIFAEGFVRGSLVVSGDAAATAQNIVAAESLYRSGFAAEMIMLCCDVALSLMLYVLLRPVNRNLALLAAFFRLMTSAVSGVNALNHIAVLLFLNGADYLSAFQPDQLAALAMLSLKTHSYGYHIALVFFGFHLALLGYLVAKSGYLPKLIGILLVIASLCYLTNSFVNILGFDFAKHLFPAIMLPCLIAEMSLTLWLLIKGVNVEKWANREA